MSYGDDGAVRELCADGGLYEVIRFHVNRCCGLIKDENLGFMQQSSGEAHELALPDTAGNTVEALLHIYVVAQYRAGYISITITRAGSARVAIWL